MKFIALDTETHMIPERLKFRIKSQEVNISPWVTPKLVCMTAYWDAVSEGMLVGAAGVFDFFKQHVFNDPLVHLIFHNAPFDLRVICKHDPFVGSKLYAMLDQGRIHDTMQMDILLRLKAGVFDIPRYPNFTLEQVVPRHLDELALEYASMQLTKDPDIRCNFHLWENRIDEMPSSFRNYAIQDAVATGRIWQRMLEISKGELLSEPLQTQASMAFAQLDEIGVHIDSAEAARLRRIFEQDMPALEAKLAEMGLGGFEPEAYSTTTTDLPALPEEGCGSSPDLPKNWVLDPEGGIVKYRVYKSKVVCCRSTKYAFHLWVRTLRERLAGVAKTIGLDEPPPTIESGEVSTEADWWGEKLPLDHELRVWLERQKLQKILTTYLYLYQSVQHVYPGWRSIGARSGRASCARPNVMNIPKRKHGIRSLFVPSPGYVFVKADYSTQELLTLAESMHSIGIEGPLLQGIKDRTDLHCFTASLLTGRTITKADKAERQAAKAVNFGVPGGLGPQKLSDYARHEYKIEWTKEQAKDMIKLYLRKFPDIRAFLQHHKTGLNANLMRVSGRGVNFWMGELGLDNRETTLQQLKYAMLCSPSPAIKKLIIDAERCLTIRLPSGRVRHGCVFTEGCNTYFQGLASDVSKLAMYKAQRAGLRVVLMVHDELVIESRPDSAAAEAKMLEECMLDAFKELCPVTGPYASVELSYPLTKWGEAKDKEGHDL